MKTIDDFLIYATGNLTEIIHKSLVFDNEIYNYEVEITTSEDGSPKVEYSIKCRIDENLYFENLKEYAMENLERLSG